MAHGDKDLQQELVLSVMDTVGNRKIHDEGLIINRMVLQRKMYKTGYLMVDKYGSSIDNGHTRIRENVKIFPYNSIEETDSKNEIVNANFSLYFCDYRSPEETALFNIDYSKFINELTVRERRFWNAKLEEIKWRSIEKLGIANRNEQPEIRRNIREKFREWLEE